jgi:hypothetical protein
MNDWNKLSRMRAEFMLDQVRVAESYLLAAENRHADPIAVARNIRNAQRVCANLTRYLEQEPLLRSFPTSTRRS